MTRTHTYVYGGHDSNDLYPFIRIERPDYNVYAAFAERDTHMNEYRGHDSNDSYSYISMGDMTTISMLHLRSGVQIFMKKTCYTNS